ncbi:alpha/beta fold hydrolase [Paenibacillus sacheonensis]|uniref:Alpha/beta fold hydrolase n=1 Tax=Paenibacillus sacheonensis TaxID=742054 RepID=A0A7X5BZC6_9BACL|nr:alpha/beta hydrolase [Paenibacillus sacheonensis]MBM7566139.1 pimeloyl-ACP methyl ester carboxylesterase [Paenibacillus sacheonensis]NBC70351.1 alpha/beta fold hydrolase [Paenibacillus sacheonensis]
MNENNYLEHRIDRGQGSIYVREYAGKDPAFVLMHGFPDNLGIYDRLVPLLTAGGRRVVVFDFLGFGASDKPAGAKYSFEQQLGDLHAVVQGLNLNKIVPVGHDASGPAAVNYAIEHPEHVESVCLMNAFYVDSPTAKYPELIELFATTNLKALTQAILRSPEQFAWVLNFQRSKFQEHLKEDQKDFYAKFLGPLIDANFRNQPSSGPAFAQMTSQLFEELAKNAKRINKIWATAIPVQLIWGETDPYLNFGIAKHLQTLLKHSSLHVLPAGHWVQLDMPDRVAQIMLGNG